MDLSDLKILLVEDEPNTRATIRAQLSEMGIDQIFEAQDGDKAQKLIDEDATDIDIVISDWNMPGKSGYEFLVHLRKKKPDMPFIMISARADQNSIMDALKANVTSYIRKPFTLGELEQKIQSIVNKI